MRYLGRRLFQVTFTIITSALLASCGSADGPSAPTPSGPKTFAIASGQTPIAGGPLLLPPIDFDATNHAALTATVGGVPTPLVVTQGGDLHVLLPLYLNPEELWFAPPSEPQDIVITANGAVVARSDEGVLIVAPPEAPDATAEALSDLTRRLDAFATWRGSFVAPAGRQDQHMFALIEGLREFLASEEAGSLRDMVANLTTEERRLGDALVAASGTRDAFSELADLAEDLPAENFSKRQADSGLCGIPFPDTELAAMMQFSAMAKEFASGYVSGVASDWSGFEASLAAFATITYLDKLPFVDGLGKALGIVNAYFALMDLIANKYVTALMPTVIESLTVTVSDPTLTAGETSESLKVICVRNDPPAFTLTDIVGQILNLVGIVADPPADVIARLENLGTIMLDRVNGFIGSYAADHPGISLDVELTSMPEISWTADIEDPDLLELMSADPAIARPLTDELEWKAPIGASGSTTIFCRPKTGPDARFVDDFLGVSYGGAAFGYDVIASNSVTISIDDLPSLKLVFTGDDEDFYLDRATAVRFRAGYIGDSATEWAAGIQVEITSATGCSFTQFSGTTDGNGYFDVDLTPFEEEFSFETLVTGAGGQDRDDEFGDYYAEPVAFDFIGGSASSTVSMESSACSPSCGQYGFFYNKYDHDSQYGPQMEGAASSLSESGSGSFDSIVLESPMTSMATASGDGSSAIMEGDDQVTLVLSATANATVEFQDNDPDEPPTYWRWNARSKGVGGASRSLFVRGWAVEVDISFTPPTKGSATLGPMGTWTHTSGFTSPDWNDTDDGVEWTGSFGPNKGFNFGISAIAEAAVEKGPDDAPGGGEDSQDSSGSLVVTLKLIPPSAMGLEAPNQGLVMRR